MKTYLKGVLYMSINNLSSFTKERLGLCIENDTIDNNLYEEYGVKRGLRDLNGIGINAGITNISLSRAYTMEDGKHTPADGELYYRGYEIRQLIDGFTKEGRFGFEECTYLLLFGKLPDENELAKFKQVLNLAYDLPHNFIQDVIMKNPTKDIISNMTKSILALGSYDKSETDISLDNVLQQCLMIISVFPRLAVYSFQGYRHYELGKSCYIHKPDPELSFAENILSMLRSDRKYTQLEAKVLDLALVLHMEHGGGSNSTFTTRVVTSSGSDTYATVAAALCSLKGPLNGGGDPKVMEMMNILMERSGMYRQALLQLLLSIHFLKKDEFKLYELIERIAPEVIAEERKIYKGVCINIDYYCGLLYKMLKIPYALYTPLFAIGRVVGWSAHRMEELINSYKIMRPAYPSLVEPKDYVPIKDR